MAKQTIQQVCYKFIKWTYYYNKKFYIMKGLEK